ncbi:uncharacterized protein LOC122047626 isoform X3 [Zingiber officinale]|uniref:uncharacterized protein LOC122047626 isoform X3 n=1 Tax=Zingiber officinale TaxID=94328 RepID=UPI001C4C83A5|nr:uncharacterized protein LOC122047626 isoform X3 [Zingiber officinale]
MVACELPHLPSIDACAKFDVGAAARHGGPTSPPTASTIDKSIKDAFTGKASDTKSTDSLAALCLHQSSIQTPELSKVVSQCKTLQQLWWKGKDRYACGRYPQLPAPRVASKPAFEEGWAPHLAFEASGILGFILEGQKRFEHTKCYLNQQFFISNSRGFEGCLLYHTATFDGIFLA